MGVNMWKEAHYTKQSTQDNSEEQVQNPSSDLTYGRIVITYLVFGEA